jgi:pimeloyl-ACP methyl ester carboxylesterase
MIWGNTDMTTAVKHEYDRLPYLIAFQNNSGVRDVYGGIAELVVLESHLLKPRTRESDTVLVFMHPIGGGAYLPMMNALARAGHHVIYCNSRFRGTDSALLMEKVVEDLGACIKDAKERLGYVKVVLAGWSGGGSLSVFYQQQAQHATVTSSPSGDGPDLTALDLPAADGLMLLAAHVSRHGTMTEWLDPSILDESDPTKRDPELDLYNPDNPNQPPYTPEFLGRFRQAQIDRNRRITAWVKDKLAELKAAGRPDDEFAFVVHGTMADPRWLDPTVDPSERKPGTCYLGDPRVVNMSPVGLARFCTLRSWLSQWSYDDAHGDAVKCGPDIAVPTLVIGNRADDACTPSHTYRLYESIGHADKEMYEIPGATHYYAGADQREPLRRAVGVVTDWLTRHGFTG